MSNTYKYEMTELHAKQIVEELNKHVVGQDGAKKVVAIAVRNRKRRKMVEEPLRDEIVPKNILMIGPTGVGKTEIARRLAKLVGAPFIKIEATKFTEVGYVGRDVDSIIRDLVEISINMVRQKLRKDVEELATRKTQDRILTVLVGETASNETREKFREKLEKNLLDEKEIEIEVADVPTNNMSSFDIPGMPGSQMGLINVGDLLGKALGVGNKTKLKKTTVAEAYKIIFAEECDGLLDEEKLVQLAVSLVENDGIVFLDEIDKIATRNDAKGGEVSREGVQRDLLPLIEGTTVSTKYGFVKTDHILFICSGAFYSAKPSDLLPELQGRLPIRVELKDLSFEDLIKILVEPKSSLLKQYEALLATEGVTLKFTKDGIEKIARMATDINRDIENIGARRLHTMLEKLLEDVSFRAEDMKGEKIEINAEYVEKQLGELVKHTDLSKFIL